MIYDLQPSPIGDKFAFIPSGLQKNGPIHILDLKTSKKEILDLAPDRGSAIYNGLSWSRDGRELAHTPGLSVYDLETRQHRLLDKLAAYEFRPLWQPSGSMQLKTE